MRLNPPARERDWADRASAYRALFEEQLPDQLVAEISPLPATTKSVGNGSLPCVGRGANGKIHWRPPGRAPAEGFKLSLTPFLSLRQTATRQSSREA